MEVIFNICHLNGYSTNVVVNLHWRCWGGNFLSCDRSHEQRVQRWDRADWPAEYREHNVAGNGNCLFHSIAHQLEVNEMRDSMVNSRVWHWVGFRLMMSVPSLLWLMYSMPKSLSSALLVIKRFASVQMAPSGGRPTALPVSQNPKLCADEYMFFQKYDA